MPKRKAEPVRLEDVVAAARRTIEERGAVKHTAIKPPAARSEVVARLGQLGFEVTRTVVRRPLAEQLRDLLASGVQVPLTALKSTIAGATSAEAKAAALTLVRQQAATIVWRGRAQVFASPDVDALQREELQAIKKALDRASKAIAAGLGRRAVPLSVLRQDVSRDLQEALEVCAAAPAPRPLDRAAGAPPLGRLLAALESSRDPRLGLAFVPRVLQALGLDSDPEGAHRLLLDAEARGLIELRPEGGLGRLSEQELSLCPPGPQGTRLSWARRRSGGAA